MADNTSDGVYGYETVDVSPVDERGMIHKTYKDKNGNIMRIVSEPSKTGRQKTQEVKDAYALLQNDTERVSFIARRMGLV